MRKIRFSLFAMLAASMVAIGAMPSSEWRAKIGECAQDSGLLKSTIVQLSGEDQLAFIGAVNEALAAKPGSVDAKAASFYEMNRAALVALTKSGNVVKALAEVYATVPPEFLTVINERFADELFKREPGSDISDEQFKTLASSAMAVIVERTKGNDNAAVRQTFASLMFVRASGNSIPGLAESLTAQLSDESAKKTAMQEWVKPALGDGQAKSYDQMLGVAQAGDEPNHEVVMRMYPNSSVGSSLLGDLRNLSLKKGVSAEKIGGALFSAPEANGLSPSTIIGDPLYRVPRQAFDPNSKDFTGIKRPQPYRGQSTKNR